MLSALANGVVFSVGPTDTMQVEAAMLPQDGSVWDGEMVEWPCSRVQVSDAVRAVVQVEGGLVEEH